MVSGFTRPNEKMARGDMMKLANTKGGAKLTDYAKTAKNIVQAAAGSKVKKSKA